MDKFFVTTAIDYVNASPHIGHAYEKIAADILARYYRLKGVDVFFLTGVDEHGSKVEKSAIQAGKTPPEFCDEMSAKFKQAWLNLNLSFDCFIRTTEKRHELVVQEIFRRLKQKGDIYKGTYAGLYCEGCEDFVRERDLDPDGNCHTHKVPPKVLKEDNYFFRLTKYKEKIKEWLITNPDVVQPESRRKEVLNQIDDAELGDFSVSRSRGSLTWGIPVADEPDQVIYVWIDALVNYITGVGFAADEKLFKRFWPADLHLIGKDITKFHAIYWPAILMAADIELPKKIYGHGFITVEGQKLSKSLGNVIDPNVLVNEFGADAVRFYLFAGIPFDQDGNFSRDEFIKKVNAELANNLGNLLNRTISLLERYCDGKVPTSSANDKLAEQANSLPTVIDHHISRLEFAKTIEAIFALLDQANKFLNDEKPWSLFKEGKNKEAESVLYTALEILRYAAMSLYPFTPGLSDAIWHQLGYKEDFAQVITSKKTNKELFGFSHPIPAGQAVRNAGPIFKRIEDAVQPSKVS